MLEMDEIDTVSVCTYNQGHRRPTVAALNAGKHVFCEKPMAATLPDATAMVRAAKASGKILQIGIHSTFNPRLQFAKKVIDSGLLGDIYYSESTGGSRRRNPGRTFIYKKTAGAGAIVDVGVYNMHDSLYVMGYPKTGCASLRLPRITSLSKIRNFAVSWMLKSSVSHGSDLTMAV